MAATQSVVAQIGFDTALGITKTSDINFGLLQASTTGTYIIDVLGHVSTTNGGLVLGGVSSAGVLSIAGSTTQTIAISTSGYLADHGVTPFQAVCSYDGAAALSCDGGLTGLIAPGAGKTLKLGLTVSSDGTQSSGLVAQPSFVVTVVYG